MLPAVKVVDILSTFLIQKMLDGKYAVLTVWKVNEKLSHLAMPIKPCFV